MKLRVNWAPDQLMTFEEVLVEPGYYLNCVSGDIYRHEGHPEATERFVGALQQAAEEGRNTVETRIWLKITDALDLTEGDVRGLLRDTFNVRMEQQGRLVSRTVWRRP